MFQVFMGVFGAAAFCLMIWDLVARKKKPDRFVIAAMAGFEILWCVNHAVDNWPQTW